VDRELNNGAETKGVSYGYSSLLATRWRNPNLNARSPAQHDSFLDRLFNPRVFAFGEQRWDYRICFVVN
jgi:hypothetical protein